MNRSKYIYGVVIVALALAGYFYFSKSTKQISQKCPDDYATSEEHMAALQLWSDDFYAKNPDANIVDWSDARHTFFVENNCVAALRRYQDALDGKTDPAVMERAEAAFQEAKDNANR